MIFEGAEERIGGERMLSHMDGVLLDHLSRDQQQDKSIQHLVQVVRVLWHHVERLEHALSATENQVTLKAGDASITMKASGTIDIKGNDVTLQGSGRVAVKAGGNLSLKGAKIEQN
jgi:hypothetical protein